jgi:hypothetical protein
MAALTTGPNFRLLSSGERLYAYSGVVVGDVSVPATIQLLKFENSGLRDLFLKLQPFYGQENSSTSGQHLGISVLIDGEEVFNSQNLTYSVFDHDDFEFFVPKQSTFEVLSLNTSNNNVQKRGCNALGWYL